MLTGDTFMTMMLITERTEPWKREQRDNLDVPAVQVDLLTEQIQIIQDP